MCFEEIMYFLYEERLLLTPLKKTHFVPVTIQAAVPRLAVKVNNRRIFRESQRDEYTVWAGLPIFLKMEMQVVHTITHVI